MRSTVLGALIFCSFVGFADEAVSDCEVWNEGVDCYRDGDMTNALKKLRPLMVSKEYASRAAEVVAKIEFERDNREEAAYAAQIALRANPKQDRARHNFARATDGLLLSREEKRLKELVQGARGTNPSLRLRSARNDARELLAAAEIYLTNAPAQAVRLADRYESKAKRLADEWIVLDAVIGESVTNQQQAATIRAQLDQARQSALRAAQEFGDMDEECYSSMSSVEQDFTRFYKLVVPPPEAIDEDLIVQSNVLSKVPTINDREWQDEALEYTRAFRSKFPQWAREYEAQAAANTNMPPFTAEVQGRISALATELEKVQLSCSETSSLEDCEKALALLSEIRELLPKNDSPQSPQSNPNAKPQSNGKKEDKSKKEEEDKSQDENKDENSERQSEVPQKNDPSKEEQTESASVLDSEDEDILKKALERSEEHEAAKKERMKKMRRPPNERDW